MSEQKWTKEPWTFKEHASVTGSDWLTILSGSWDIAHNRHSARDWEEERANARRIVACVNALRGIPDPEAFMAEVWEVLESWIPLGKVCDGYMCDCKKNLDDTNDLLAKRPEGK